MFDPKITVILAGVDGSPRSRPVLQWADEQAQLTGRPLVVLTAAGTEPGTGEWTDAAGEQAAYRALARAVAGALPKERAAEATLRVVPDSPEEALVRATAEAGVVVIGAHHAHPLHPLGSVTARVITAAHCPVVVVRRLPPLVTGRIVVGVDGAPTSRPALRWAVEQAALRGAKVDAVLAWEWTPEYPVIPYGPEVTRVRAQREELLAAELALLAPDDAAAVHGIAVEGHPMHVLLDAAKDADLLVVGTHGHGPIAGRFLGSVSRRLVRHAPVPVVVVPSRGA